MNRKLRIVSMLLSLVLVVSIVTACSDESNKVIVDMDDGVLYASYNSFEDAMNASDIAVLGTIKEIKTSHFPSFDINKEWCSTPIVIEVENVAKGDWHLEGKEITFDALGGETEDKIFMTKAYPTNSLEVGDVVYVFLDLDERYNAYTVISPNMFYVADKNGMFDVEPKMLLELDEGFYKHDGKVEDASFASFMHKANDLASVNNETNK